MAQKLKDVPESSRLTASYEHVRKRNYAILYLVTAAVFLALVIRSLVLNEFDPSSLLDDLFGNMMGAIPALLLFDIFYQKLNEENDAVEATKRFTDAIMSNPDNIGLFEEEQRRVFLRSNIESFHADPDIRDMLTHRMEPYLDGATSMAYSAIRPRFTYDIALMDSDQGAKGLIRNPNDTRYFYMQQKLAYKIKYMAWAPNREIGSVFYVAFPFGNKNLDAALRESQESIGKENSEPRVVFTESLDLAQDDIEALLAEFDSPDTEAHERLVRRFKDALRLSVKVNSENAQIEDVKLNEDGIIAVCRRNPDLNQIEEGDSKDDFLVYDIRVVFTMPRLWGRPLAVFMMDPTKAPNITLSYPPDTMEVEMATYLSTGEESAIANALEKENGLYDISISSEWMYPVSGMVFEINPYGTTAVVDPSAQ